MQAIASGCRPTVARAGVKTPPNADRGPSARLGALREGLQFEDAVHCGDRYAAQQQNDEGGDHVSPPRLRRQLR
jgi:hypothetical protein